VEAECDGENLSARVACTHAAKRRRASERNQPGAADVALIGATKIRTNSFFAALTCASSFVLCGPRGGMRHAWPRKNHCRREAPRDCRPLGARGRACRVDRLVEVNLNSDMVLVRRDVAEVQLAKHAPQPLPAGPGGNDPTVTGNRPLSDSRRPETGVALVRAPAASTQRSRSIRTAQHLWSAISPNPS
jgi:hypothetical protein